jgi:hypothetical protein
MTTVRLLYNVGNEAKGAVLQIEEPRARRLIQMGYAEPVIEPAPKRKTKKETPTWPPSR